MYDIAIVGGGPAGATLARLIGSRYKVLLLDKRHLTASQDEDPHVKCCGGLLAPDAQKVLAELGLGVPQKVLAGPQLFVVRTIDLKHAKERYYQRFYINLDREEFDRWLVTLIPDCVDLRFGCTFKGYEKKEEGYKIEFTCKGKLYSENAKILIGADGALSKVRRLAVPHQPFAKEYVAIQEWFEASKVSPYFSAIFDDDITDFYSWTIPKGNYLLLGAALALKDNAPLKFELLKKKLNEYGFEFGKLAKREGAYVVRPQTTANICTGIGTIALVGEAAGWISPSSAEGFSYAFRSAIMLSQSLQQGTDNFLHRYTHSSRGLRMNIWAKNMKSPFMYNPWIRRMVMNTGIQSLDIYKQ